MLPTYQQRNNFNDMADFNKPKLLLRSGSCNNGNKIQSPSPGLLINHGKPNFTIQRSTKPQDSATDNDTNNKFVQKRTTFNGVFKPSNASAPTKQILQKNSTTSNDVENEVSKVVLRRAKCVQADLENEDEENVPEFIRRQRRIQERLAKKNVLDFENRRSGYFTQVLMSPTSPNRKSFVETMASPAIKPGLEISPPIQKDNISETISQFQKQQSEHKESKKTVYDESLGMTVRDEQVARVERVDDDEFVVNHADNSQKQNEKNDQSTFTAGYTLKQVEETKPEFCGMQQKAHAVIAPTSAEAVETTENPKVVPIVKDVGKVAKAIEEVNKSAETEDDYKFKVEPAGNSQEQTENNMKSSIVATYTLEQMEETKPELYEMQQKSSVINAPTSAEVEKTSKDEKLTVVTLVEDVEEVTKAIDEVNKAVEGEYEDKFKVEPAGNFQQQSENIMQSTIVATYTLEQVGETKPELYEMQPESTPVNSPTCVEVQKTSKDETPTLVSLIEDVITKAVDEVNKAIEEGNGDKFKVERAGNFQKQSENIIQSSLEQVEKTKPELYEMHQDTSVIFAPTSAEVKKTPERETPAIVTLFEDAEEVAKAIEEVNKAIEGEYDDKFVVEHTENIMQSTLEQVGETKSELYEMQPETTVIIAPRVKKPPESETLKVVALIEDVDNSNTKNKDILVEPKSNSIVETPNQNDHVSENEITINAPNLPSCDPEKIENAKFKSKTIISFSQNDANDVNKCPNIVKVVKDGQNSKTDNELSELTELKFIIKADENGVEVQPVLINEKVYNENRQ